MAEELRHIEHIDDTDANLQSNLDVLQVGIQTDGDENLVYKDDDGTYHKVANENEAASFTTVTTTADLVVADNIIHSGDTDTKIAFDTNLISAFAGGVTILGISTNALKINPNSADVDINIYGNSTTPLMSTDASANTLTLDKAIITNNLSVDTTTLVVNAAGYTDNVGIGTEEPVYKFQVRPATDVNFGLYNTSGTLSLIAVNDVRNSWIPLKILASRITTSCGINILSDTAPGCALCVNGGVSIGSDAATADNCLDVTASAKIGTKLETAGTLCLSGVQELIVGALDAITNGTFDSNTWWSHGGNGSISMGQGVLGAPTEGVIVSLIYRETIATMIGVEYTLTFDIIDANVEVFMDGAYAYAVVKTPGLVQTVVFTATTTNLRLFFYRDTASAAKIDNVSLVRVTTFSVALTHSVLRVTNSSGDDINVYLTGDTLDEGVRTIVEHKYQSGIDYILTVLGLAGLPRCIDNGHACELIKSAEGWMHIDSYAPPA